MRFPLSWTFHGPFLDSGEISSLRDDHDTCLDRSREAAPPDAWHSAQGREGTVHHVDTVAWTSSYLASALAGRGMGRGVAVGVGVVGRRATSLGGN